MSLQRNLTIGVLIAIIGVLGVIAALSFAGAGDDDDPDNGGLNGDECEITVDFNETVTQADIEEVEAMLRALDPDVEFVVMESFPPIGVGRLDVKDRSLCDSLVDELRDKSYVESVSWQTFDPVGPGNPDEPVSTMNEG